MTLEELRDRTEQRLQIALGIGEEAWIARLQARLTRYEARLKRRAEAEEAASADGASSSAGTEGIAPELAGFTFMQQGFGPDGRPRRDPNAPLPKLQLPKRVSLAPRDQVAAAAKPECTKDDTPKPAGPEEFVFSLNERDAAKEISLSPETDLAVAAFEARNAVQRKTRLRQFYRERAGI